MDRQSTPRNELFHVLMLCRILYKARDGWTCRYICCVNVLDIASQK